MAPLDHVLPVAEEEVNVTDPGEQKVVGPPAVIVGVAGNGLTVTLVTAEVRVHPAAFETVTVNEPDVVTVIVCVVAPFDHKYEVDAGAESVTEPPAQNVVGPPAVIVGMAGKAFTVTTVAALAALKHPEAFPT